LIEHKVGEFSRTINVSVRADRLKVGDVLAFADKLREAQVPWTEQISDDHSHETHHLIGLRVHYSEELRPTGESA
jgi:hypothetical protein